MTDHLVTNVSQLEQLYGLPSGTAVSKESAVITQEYRSWILASPFCVMATAGPGGLDATPRGDPAGDFVTVEDERTLLLPDRLGSSPAFAVLNPFAPELLMESKR